jgi:hypothetical protein
MSRSQNESREQRKQYEEDYRHHFFQIVVDVLCELQFPPTLEAFSNPLQSLREDMSFKHEAMWFLVQRTTDQSVQRRGFSASGTPRQMKQQNDSPCFPDNDLSRTASHEDDMGPNMSTRPSTPTSQRQGNRTANSAASSRPTPRTPVRGSSTSARSKTSPHQVPNTPSGHRSYGGDVPTSPMSQAPRSIGDYDHLYRALQVKLPHSCSLQANIVDMVAMSRCCSIITSSCRRI